MRPALLNTLTAAATVALLTTLSIPAVRVLDLGASDGGIAAPAPALAVSALPASLTFAPPRMLGVYVDPWHVDDWGRAVGVRPQLVARFEAFARQRTVDAFLREAERQGVHHVMVSWEPWKPVPATAGGVKQGAPQPGYTNREIAAGGRDAYITAFARSLASFQGTVYLRYAHEMNGFWYPWAHDAAQYRRAWRHVMRLVRTAGASNVRSVWSVNPNLYEPRRRWMANVRRYWPGRAWVDVVGTTMIDFGGRKDYPVARFEPRLRRLWAAFAKPVFLTETNTAQRGRVRWLRDLRGLLARRPWIRAMAWSQLPSRGAAATKGLGNMNWDITRDPPAAAQMRAVGRVLGAR